MEHPCQLSTFQAVQTPNLNFGRESNRVHDYFHAFEQGAVGKRSLDNSSSNSRAFCQVCCLLLLHQLVKYVNGQCCVGRGWHKYGVLMTRCIKVYKI